MKKKVQKTTHKMIYKKLDLLEDVKMSFLNSIFVMIYRIHKIWILLKKHLNYLKVFSIGL